MFDYRLKLLQYYNINKSTKNVRTVRIQNSTNLKKDERKHYKMLKQYKKEVFTVSTASNI